MSGIEVVGVVLGAIPLIISGLEHYAEGADTIKRIFRAGQEFRTVARKLDAEHVVFRNTLTILLNDCIDVEAQKALMSDVGGTRWHDKDVAEALTHRLQSSYDSYIDHIRSIERSIQAFRDRLHIDEKGQVPFNSPYSFREAYKRLHFAMKKEKYLDLIRDIHDDNSHLDRLTLQTKALQSSRRARRTPDFGKFRASATAVFETLKRGLHVSCGASHKASMCLAHNAGSTVRLDLQRFRLDEDDAFRIVLHHDTGVAVPNVWSLEEAEIRLIDVFTSSAATNLATLSIASSAMPVKSSKKTVQFTSTTSIAASAITRPVTVQAQEIDDLCASIEQLRASKCGICLGYMKCNSSHHRHELYWPEKRLLESPSLSVETLANVIHRKANTPIKITKADARRLAVPLASGILRLYETPWLEKAWSDTDISVICQKGGVIADYPFVTQNLSTTPPTQSIQGAQQSPMSVAAGVAIQNVTLFGLGLILIELCMEKPMSELHLAAEKSADGTKHELSDFLTASRLLDMEEISDRFGQRWSEVVRRCIRCDLNQSKSSLQDAGFRKAVYNEVVAELEEDRKQFFNLS